MSTKTEYKYLGFLLMLFMTIKITTVILIYKIVQIGPLTFSASTLIMPFWFVLSDLITEVYGYRFAKNAIWTALLCQFLFAALCMGAIHLNSPPGWAGQEAYQQILGKLHLVTTGSFLAVISGAFINAYAISKWKVLLHGKYFWLRSLGSSVVGELVFTVVAYLVEFVGSTTPMMIFQLMALSFLGKLIFTPIFIIPSMYAAAFLKKVERIDTYDTNINYNPFSFKITPTPPPLYKTEGSL